MIDETGSVRTVRAVRAVREVRVREVGALGAGCASDLDVPAARRLQPAADARGRASP
jgi:hypothetical protein